MHKLSFLFSVGPLVMLSYLSMVVVGGGPDTVSVSAREHLDFATGIFYTFGVVRTFRAVCSCMAAEFIAEKNLRTCIFWNNHSDAPMQICSHTEMLHYAHYEYASFVYSGHPHVTHI